MIHSLLALSLLAAQQARAAAIASTPASIRPLPTGAAAVQLVGDTADLVVRLMTLDLGAQGAALTAPNAATEGIAPTSLTIAPEDRALIAAYLEQARQIAPREDAGSVTLPADAGAPAQPLRSADQPTNLDSPDSNRRLAAVITALRDVAARGPMDRATAIEVSQRIFDGSRAGDASAAEAPILAMPSPLLLASLPESAVRTPNGATLAGREGDEVLGSAQRHALDWLLARDARESDELSKRPMGERLLGVILEVQGFASPVPLKEWLGVGAGKLGARTAKTSSLTGFVSAINAAVDAWNEGRKRTAPRISFENVYALPGHAQEGLRTQVILNLNAAKAGDLRRAGAFLYDGRIYFTDTFLNRARPHQLAAALFAMEAARAGFPAKAVEAVTRKITETAFAKTAGGVRLETLAELASLSAFQPRESRKNGESTTLAKGTGDAPAPSLGKRARAGLSAAWRALRRLPSAARGWAAFLPAALLAAYVAVLALRAGALPSAESAFGVLLLALGGVALRRFSPRAEDPAPSEPKPAVVARDFTLDTKLADFMDIEEDVGDNPDVVVRRAISFDLEVGEASIGIDQSGQNFIDITFAVPEDGTQSYYTIVSDDAFREAADKSQLIPVTRFLKKFWPGLRDAAREFADDDGAKKAPRKTVREFLTAFQGRLMDLLRGGDDAPAFGG
ncbi:MAG TPA: hypothetical protein VNI01_14360 [Elusimicrobiota bacterium]|nr:hypothetical protein [Elusimicrobiota bacterium]